METDSLHATHHRKVQDLPILRKRVTLDINLYEFDRVDPDCIITSFTETFENFLNRYSYMTERSVDLMTTIAIETSCESCARILKSMNIKTVDDLAYKKRHTYGTMIVDEETHRPVAILDGRDGVALKARIFFTGYPHFCVILL